MINNIYKKLKLDKLMKFSTDLLWELRTIRKHLELNSKFIASSELHELKTEYLNKQLSFLETMELIKSSKTSLVRFGDGEFRMMFHEVSLKFQKFSPAIRKDLLESYYESSVSPNILVALPHFYEDLHWTTVWVENKYNILDLISNVKEFGNAHVTRPIFFSQHQNKAVELWREVWKDEEITVVTGKNSRFNAIPELFSSSKSIDNIDLEPINAYETLDMDNIIKNIKNKNSLLVIALGPAGTILSYKLASLGYWAIDIGHISSSYETVFSKGKWPEALATIENRT